ncbi:expressed unknown protein [Ectocarpus siliculosus]|uniref:Membrane-associated protein n=1 Tax=Ectocarpus siliculosus TaxID=2880 RepID=D7FZ14_ECTSI|nr:expressed unknown protein [Ectocarpus siliculosus]|eukprot:CBJ32631.1 expressed unknown protein [Ectocarpus siliculosus]
MNPSMHKYQAVLLACALFVVAVWVGTQSKNNNSSTTVAGAHNLRSTNSHEKHQTAGGGGLTMPAHVSAPKTNSFSAVTLPSPSNSEEKANTNTEDYVWPGEFALESFESLKDDLSYDFGSFAYEH